jgi:hypothetical protein
VPEAPREDQGDQASEGVSDQQEGRIDTGALEQCAQLSRDAAGRSREGTRIAPSEAGAIIAADARQTAHRRLHQRPAHRGAAKCGVQHDRGRALPGAEEMKPVTADIDQPPGRIDSAHDPAYAGGAAGVPLDSDLAEAGTLDLDPVVSGFSVAVAVLFE